MDEDRRAAGDDRRRVSPQPQREAEPEVGGADRVRALPRHERRRRRDADHERVERLVELDPLQHRPAKQCFGVRDRRRAAVDHRRGLLARQPVEHALAHPRRRELEDPAHVRAQHPLDGLLVVRVAGERPGDARRVEPERHAGQPRRARPGGARSRPRAASPATRSSRAARALPQLAATRARLPRAVLPARRAARSRQRSP